MAKDFSQFNKRVSSAEINASAWLSDYSSFTHYSPVLCDGVNPFCAPSFRPSISTDRGTSTVATRSEPSLVQSSSDRPSPNLVSLDSGVQNSPSTSTSTTLATTTSLPADFVSSSSTTTPSVSDRVGTGISPSPGTSTTTSTLEGVSFSTLVFNGNEGATGTFQVQLNLPQAPTSSLTLTFAPGSFLVVDADNNLANGTQNTLTFTPTDWNQTRTVWFIAEKDGVSTDRLTGNTIAYSLNTGSTITTGTFDIGSVKNTYAPDTTRFNIDLDFRNDTTGFWTEARRAIAQKAADDWVYRIDLGYQIVSEWTGIQLNNAISKIGNDGNYTAQTFSTKQYVDDLLVFVNTINTAGTAGGYGGPEYEIGGWLTSPDLMPRVGQIAIDPAVGDRYLYNAVSHEIGHTLGLVGLNWAGFLQQDLTTPQTAIFKGAYSTAVNGGNFIPLQSQDGPNPVTGTYDYWHPAQSVQSMMSYGWMYSLSAPTILDYAMLADSGYAIAGINAPLPTSSSINTPSAQTPSTPATTTSTVSIATTPVAATIV